MTGGDTCDIGNISFDRRESAEDVAYVGRFDAELARWRRRALPGSDLAVTKLAIALFLARYARVFR